MAACPQRLPPQRELSFPLLCPHPRLLPQKETVFFLQMTEKFPLHQSLHTPIAGKPMAHAIGFPAIQFPQRRMSTAALSAAVDSTKLIEATSNSQAEPSKQNHTSRTLTALRERGVWGERRFSQRSGLSPQRLPTPSSLEEGARGRGLFYRKVPSLAYSSTPLGILGMNGGMGCFGGWRCW